jgi:hypothetical protein
MDNGHANLSQFTVTSSNRFLSLTVKGILPLSFAKPRQTFFVDVAVRPVLLLDLQLFSSFVNGLEIGLNVVFEATTAFLSSPATPTVHRFFLSVASVRVYGRIFLLPVVLVV